VDASGEQHQQQDPDGRGGQRKRELPRWCDGTHASEPPEGSFSPVIELDGAQAARFPSTLKRSIEDRDLNGTRSGG
jgi:hypothetical protein